MVVDYYAMLGVVPTADRTAIDEALSRCQPVWSAGTRNPKTKHTYQSYLDQIPAIRQTLLGDPATRTSYDIQRTAAARIERDRKLDQLQHLVKLRAAKGGLTVTDRDLLRSRADALGLDRDDLDKLIEVIPLKAEPPAEVDAPDAQIDVIEPATRRQIRLGLDHLGLRDLYDALSLPADAPADVLMARADEERQRWMRKSQVTAEKTAWLEVVSYAQSHLGNPAARTRYDATLVLEAEEALIEQMKFAVAGVPRLDPGTRLVLVDEALARGIPADRAERLLGRVCKSLGVARDTPPHLGMATVPTRWLRCRSCGGLTDHSGLTGPEDKPAPCRHCGANLRWACPVCARSRWVDERRCACGFPLERLEILLKHFEAAQDAFKTRDDATALELLTRVRALAPNHVGARKGIERVHQRQADVQRLKVAYQSARSARQFVAAKQAVQGWAKLVDPTTADVLAAGAEVARTLHEAQTHANRAVRLEATDSAAARALYRQALSLVADLAEAREGLMRCPPDPPTDLRVMPEGDGLRLTWKPPAADDLGPLRFRVMRGRGAGARPEVVGETDAHAFDDLGVTPGESVSYSVLSLRGLTRSMTAANAGPLLVIGAPENLRAEGRDGEIELSWSLPAFALGAHLIRKTGSTPSGPEDGTLIPALRESAIDRGLRNDTVYHYAVFAEYRDSGGAMSRSTAALVTAAPHPPDSGLDAPRLTREPNGRVRLDWTAPRRGRARILRAERPLFFPASTRLTPVQVEALAGIWLESSANDHAFDPDPPAVGLCHYTPMTLWAGTWTVGHSIAFSSIPDPTDLRAVRVNGAGRVHLRWRWSPRVAQSKVVYKPGGPPAGADDPEAHSLVVSEGEYSRQGYQTLTLPADVSGPWHLAVFSIAVVDGVRLTSAGLEPTARTVVPGPNPEVTVSYTLRKEGFAGRTWSLLFKTEPAGALIPPVALVSHPRAVPLSVDDGEVVARFPASRDGVRFTIPPGLDLGRHLTRIFADPAVDPETLTPIRFRHPESGQPRA